MAFDPLEFLTKRSAALERADHSAPAPLAGTKAERMQRLQIGVFGIFSMVLLIALADAVTDRMAVADATAVPEAAPTVVASDSVAPRDPLADAGVVPDLPAEPTAGASATPTGDVPPPVLPTTSNAPLQ